MFFLEFRRDGTGEPFLIKLEEVKGVAFNGLVVNNGEVVFTEETYQETIKKLEDALAIVLRSNK